MIAAFVTRSAAEAALRAEYMERQALAGNADGRGIVSKLEQAAAETGEPYRRMHSGAAHDTMCVADRVPTAWSSSRARTDQPPPAEHADSADAALAGRDHPERDRGTPVARARRALRLLSGASSVRSR